MNSELNSQTAPTLGQIARLSWFLGWRLFLLNLFYSDEVGWELGRAFVLWIGSKAVGIALIVVVLWPILIVIYYCLFKYYFRLLVTKHFKSFRIVLLRSTGAVDNTSLSIKELLSIWWLLTWRAWVISVLLGGVYGFLYPYQQQPEWLRLIAAWQPYFLGYPWAITVMLRKQFSGFRLRLVPVQHRALSATSSE
jgi:hypothetical protein